MKMKGLISFWKRLPKPLTIIGYVLLGLLGAILLGFLFGKIIQLLWNAILPDIFGIKKITFWQGVGIFVLAKILINPFGNKIESGKTHVNMPRNS